MYSSNFIKYLLYIISLIFFIGIWLYVFTSLQMIFTTYPPFPIQVNAFLSIFFNVLILIFELITALYGIFLLIHTALVFNKTEEGPDFKKLDIFPIVSLIIPTFNPDLYAIETNLLNLSKLAYPNKEVFITDNSDDPHIVKQLEKLTQKFNVNFLHRDGLSGFKAKNLNNAIERISGKYFLIIDIDQSLKESSIEKFVYLFEKSKNNDLAFIQGRFAIKNADNIIRTSIAILYTFFYDVISLAKSYRGTVLFNGSSGCFRTNIVRTIGGFPENCYTEDIAISNKLLLNGYNSLYLNDSVTTALVPWKLTTLLSSFWRWTHGGTSCLNLYGKDIIKSKKISLDKKIELLMNGISFIAISGILIVICSMLCMYWLNLEIVRPDLILYKVSFPLYLFFPIFTSLNHLINCLIGMWESKTLHRILYLIPYSIASIAISVFILFPTYYAILGIKGPDSPNSRWNRKFNVSKVIIILSLTFVIFTYSWYSAFLQNNLLWPSFASMSLLSISTIVFLLKDIKIDVPKEDYTYFYNFRKQNGFEITSEYQQVRK